MRPHTIIPYACLLILLAAGAFIGYHIKPAGYVTFTLSFGDDAEPIKLAQADKPPPVLKNLPLPQRKPVQ